MDKKTLKMSKRELASAFRSAAKALDKYGWKQDSMGSTDTKFCAMGALNHILGVNFGKQFVVNFDRPYPAKNGLIAKTIPGCVNKNMSISDIIIAYNDGIEDTFGGKQEVQKLFRTLASGLEHGGVL